MATTKKTTKQPANKSGRSSSSAKNKRKKKASSNGSMKFLFILVIVGIAIALIFFSKKDKTTEGDANTPTPTITEAAAEISKQPEAEPTSAPTAEPTKPLQEAESTPMPLPTVTPAPTNTPTPTPTPALSAAEAEKAVKDKVDTAKYNVQLINENLIVGNERYYQFGAIKNQEFISPFLVVSKADGSLHFYNSTEGTVYDFTKFPEKEEVTPSPTPTPEPAGVLTAKEAYEVLCGYSKEALHIAKNVKEYDVEYDEELTFINGIDCYRFNLSEFSNGKVRNRGEFYISVDGKKCYYIDNDTNEFIQAVK